MEQKVCLTLIKNAKSKFTPAENIVADYILANSEKTLHMTVAELSKEAGVAGSSVIRFCESLGYSGFSDLKINLARNPASFEEVVLPAVKRGDDIGMVFEKVFCSSIKTLNDTLAMMDMKQVSKAVDLLKKANRTEFYGVGTSATIAMDAYYRVMRIGYPAFYATDSHIMRICAANLGKGCVGVGISHCGATNDTVEAMCLAKESGADTIAITSYNNSPICRYADVVLAIYSDEARYPIEAVSARIAHIAVLDAICVALSLEQYQRTMEHVKSMNLLFKDLRKK